MNAAMKTGNREVRSIVPAEALREQPAASSPEGCRR